MLRHLFSVTERARRALFIRISSYLFQGGYTFGAKINEKATFGYVWLGDFGSFYELPNGNTEWRWHRGAFKSILYARTPRHAPLSELIPRNLCILFVQFKVSASFCLPRPRWWWPWSWPPCSSWVIALTWTTTTLITTCWWPPAANGLSNWRLFPSCCRVMASASRFLSSSATNTIGVSDDVAAVLEGANRIKADTSFATVCAANVLSYNRVCSIRSLTVVKVEFCSMLTERLLVLLL